MPQTLTLAEIKERLKRPKSRERLARAARHEARLRLHGTLHLTEFDARTAATAVTDFLSWVEGTLNNAKKFNLFCRLFRFPIPTVAKNAQIFGALEKVFDGRNPVQQYDFLTPEAAQDWQDYREAKHFAGFIRRNVFDTVVEGCINSLVVVDLPQEQESSLPEPYPYILQVEHVHDYGWNGESFDYVAFPQKGDRMAWFDRTHYRLFQLKEGSRDEIIGTIAEIEHGLGYTPVRWMWDDPVNGKDTDLKESPVSKQLGEMDWLLFYLISKRVNELTAQYPVYWAYQPDCEFVEQKQEFGIYRKCHNGFLKDGKGEFIVNRNTLALEPCPACSKSRMLGAGSMVHKPIPGEGEKDIGNPVGVVPAEAVSLEYNKEEVQRIWKEIFKEITGGEAEAVNNQAVNEKQVASIVSAQTQVLKNLKVNFESLQKWTDATLCRLRYGDLFTGCTINLGTEFHLQTAAELLDTYEKRRREGATASTLDRLYEDYLSARYRFDPIMQKREKILMHLDPFRHRTAAEAAGMEGTKPEYVYLKFNFSSLVARFEREHGDLTTYADAALDFAVRVDIIKKILIGYVEEEIQPTESRDPEAAGSTSTGSEGS